MIISEQEKNRIRGLHKDYSIIKENKSYADNAVIHEQFDFSWEGIKNIPGYWADKAGVDKSDIDVSYEGIKNIPNWWSDKFSEIAKEEIKNDAGRKDEESILNKAANKIMRLSTGTTGSEFKAPSATEIKSALKNLFCPWCEDE